MPETTVRCSAPEVERQLEQLVGLGHTLAGDHLGDAQIDLGEVVDGDLGRERRRAARGDRGGRRSPGAAVGVGGRHPLRDQRGLALGVDAREHRLRLASVPPGQPHGGRPLLARSRSSVRAGAGSPARRRASRARSSRPPSAGLRSSRSSTRAARRAARILGQRPGLRSFDGLFEVRIKRQIDSSARDGLKLVPGCRSARRATGSARCSSASGCGRRRRSRAPTYRCTIETVRFSRLPRSLPRSDS